MDVNLAALPASSYMKPQTFVCNGVVRMNPGLAVLLHLGGGEHGESMGGESGGGKCKGDESGDGESSV